MQPPRLVEFDHPRGVQPFLADKHVRDNIFIQMVGIDMEGTCEWVALSVDILFDLLEK